MTDAARAGQESFELLGRGRIFASHYQMVVADGPDAFFDQPNENWTDDCLKRGYSGNPQFRMFGTVADFNDHWVELSMSDNAPRAEDWERIIRFDFTCETGTMHVKGILDLEPIIESPIPVGRYMVHACGANLGQQHEGEEMLDDATLSTRRDLEWYHIVIVPTA